MNAARLVVFFVGVTLVVISAWMLFFQVGLNRWIPVGIAATALLLFIGVVIMGASEHIPPEHHETHVEHIDEHGHHH